LRFYLAKGGGKDFDHYNYGVVLDMPICRKIKLKEGTMILNYKATIHLH